MPLALKPKKRISEIDFSVVDELAGALNCSRLFAQILYNRGFTTAAECKKILQSQCEDDYDAFSMLNMDKLVTAVQRVRDTKGKITVYGDYDVDGISATAILISTFRKMNIEADYYIPDRHSEGYGLNEEALNKIYQGGTSLVITVDCGIASAELIQKQMDMGREIIVTDHHNINGDIPGCVTVKPGQPGDTYKNVNLCGAGIAYKISKALLFDEAEEFVDYACVATIADVVPLIDENRSIVKKGLEKLNTNPRPCYKALLEIAKATGKVTAQTVGFTISPRLNASGRMASATDALELLLAGEEAAPALAQRLNELNKLRQETELKILEEAETQISEKGSVRNFKVLVLSGRGWHEGVVGICAARLAEKYRRPCIMLSISEEGKAKGSARSVDGINLFEMLKSTEDILLSFGGHAMAAGIGIKEENIDALQARLDFYLRENYDLRLLYPQQEYDAKASLKEITPEFCLELELLEPYGAENPEITLRVDNCNLGGIKKIGSAQNHLKMYLTDASVRVSAVAFNYAKHNCDYFNCQTASFIVKPELNCWQGNTSVSLRICDVKETQNIKPRHKAELLTALFFYRLITKKTGEASVVAVDESEELAYMISEWCDEDISGTLILCDHAEYASGLVQMLEEEAPRFDISFNTPISKSCGYNSCVIGAEISKIDFAPFKRIIFFDMLNTGYADEIGSRAPWAELYSLKVGLSLFDSVFEEYRALSTEDMRRAYKAITLNQGVYESLNVFLEAISQKEQISMPLLAAALATFGELEFIIINSEEGFSVNVNKAAPKHKLEESRYYVNLLRCLSRNKV